jgi:hypothetical protein
MGLPDGVEPAVDVGVRPGDEALRGGIYRVALHGQTIHGFATTLPLRRCRDVLDGLPDGGNLVRLHHDAATEVTLVHTVIPTGDAPRDGRHLEPVLEALLAAEVVHELTDATT